MTDFLTSKSSAISTFEKRKKYHESVSQLFELVEADKEKYIIDTFGDRGRYGRIDRMNRPVAARQNKIISSKYNKREIYGFDFVIDAWLEFVSYYSALAYNLNIPINFSRSSVFSQHIFFQEFQTFSIPFLQLINEKISTRISSKNVSKIQYKSIFLSILRDTDKSFGPESFLFSPSFSPLLTGLVIETDKGNFLDDEKKVRKFWEKRHFSAYLESAKRFGFLVDEFAPWRLFFDLNSPAASYYITRRSEFYEIQERILSGEENSTHDLTNFIERFGNLGNRQIATVHLDKIFNEYFVLLETQTEWLEDLASVGFSLFVN